MRGSMRDCSLAAATAKPLSKPAKNCSLRRLVLHTNDIESFHDLLRLVQFGRIWICAGADVSNHDQITTVREVPRLHVRKTAAAEHRAPVAPDPTCAGLRFHEFRRIEG